MRERDASMPSLAAPVPRSCRFTRADILACLLLIALNLVWLRTLSLGFFPMDDAEYVFNNAHVFNGLSLDSVRWAFTTTTWGFWFPLTWLSLQLDATLFGTSAWGYHLTNVLFHIANTLLVYVFFRAALRSSSRFTWRSALFAAALFSIHPQRVESVAWIVERKDVLAFFFGMLSVLAYLRYARTPSRARYAWVLLLYLASLWSKPMLVTLPAVLLLLDYFPLGRLTRRRAWPLIREKIPLALVGIAMSVNTFMIQFAAGSLASTWPVRLKNTLLNAFLYPRDFFYTGRLVIVDAARLDIPLTHVLASTAFPLALAIVLILLLRRRHPAAPALLVGLGWFYIVLIPMSGLLQSGINIRADRFTYFPEVGLLMALVYGLPQLFPRAIPRNAAITFAPTAAALLVVAITLFFMLQRLSLWRDPLLLFEHDLSLEDNAMMHQVAGSVARDRGLREKALFHFRRAGEIEPGLRYLAPVTEKEFADQDAATRPAATRR